MTHLNQELLKQHLNYDPDTGIFTRKIALTKRTFVGQEIGCKHSQGYIEIRLLGKRYLAHRLAWLYMTGSFPEYEIDHINHSREDNRFSNLRSVTRSTNQRNKTNQVNNKSGCPGVYWNTGHKKWIVQVKTKGLRNNLGSFSTKEEAISVRNEFNRNNGFHSNHGGVGD